MVHAWWLPSMQQVLDMYPDRGCTNVLGLRGDSHGCRQRIQTGVCTNVLGLRGDSPWMQTADTDIFLHV